MSEYLIETRGLCKQFGNFQAVRSIDLQVKRGHIHALIGPNGAGKTTCFNLLTKALEPSGGSIHYDGRDITKLPPAKVALLGMVRSFQISAIFPTLTVKDNVRVALQRRQGRSMQFWQSDRVLASLNERAMALLTDVGLASLAERVAGELPYGRKRALEIATTLALEPKMLLLDEPTAGMGLEDVQAIASLIRRVSEGRTVLMVEHNLGVVADLADRITVLAEGQVLSEGTYAQVSSDERVRAAYIGKKKNAAT
ncbi:ABC transporter ATP-binding protein [Ottowia thiooxydans]|uniref:ABC transporter ATP-binding protein n=1 Tax=Ottowia thiooxydans TaxID=219182 RepID=UPI0004298692|nr:ABC transporter ATP-binding protein [Ottowia thiooxydans]